MTAFIARDHHTFNTSGASAGHTKQPTDYTEPVKSVDCLLLILIRTIRSGLAHP